MKYKKTFVTNSSSTSYTIVINNKKPEGYFSLTDILKVMLGRGSVKVDLEKCTIETNIDNRYFDIYDIDTYLINAKINQEYFGDQVKFYEDKVEKYFNALKLDDVSLDLFGGRENIESKLRESIAHLKEYQKQMEQEKKNIDILEQFDNKQYDVIFADIDNWSSNGIQELIEKSGAIILHKETT